MIHLLNGATAPRQRNSEGVTVLECGCSHDATHWLQMCDADYSDWASRRSCWLADHAAEDLIR